MNKFQRRINFFDADPAGVMFFGHVYSLCHSAYEELVAGFGLPENYFNHPEIAIPVVHSEADYMKPLYPGEEVTIEIEAGQIGKSSFNLLYSVYNSRNEKAASVKTAHVFIDKKSFSKRSIPGDFLQKLNGINAGN